MTWYPLRFVSPVSKLAYLFLCFLAALLVSMLVPQWAETERWVALCVAVGSLGAMRWFRVSGEPVAPPRPWWKATGRPLASWVLALVSGIYTLIPAGELIWYDESAAPFLLVFASLTIYLVISGTCHPRSEG